MVCPLLMAIWLPLSLSWAPMIKRPTLRALDTLAANLSTLVPLP
jgi:hypothetical protein